MAPLSIRRSFILIFPNWILYVTSASGRRWHEAVQCTAQTSKPQMLKIQLIVTLRRWQIQKVNYMSNSLLFRNHTNACRTYCVYCVCYHDCRSNQVSTEVLLLIYVFSILHDLFQTRKPLLSWTCTAAFSAFFIRGWSWYNIRVPMLPSPSVDNIDNVTMLSATKSSHSWCAFQPS
jgi:hypothetical protein